MSSNLVIVESPAKAKTIEKYLGKDFKVLASYGHVRDLIPKEGAVEPDNGFKMNYEVVERNEKHINNIAKLLKKADNLYLATDPDREGEAISWHLYELLQERNLMRGKQALSRGILRNNPPGSHRSGCPSQKYHDGPGECSTGTARTRLSGWF